MFFFFFTKNKPKNDINLGYVIGVKVHRNLIKSTDTGNSQIMFLYISQLYLKKECLCKIIFHS